MVRDCDHEKALVEDEMNRVMRTGRQPSNKKPKGKNNRSFVRGKSFEGDRDSESISECASNNFMEIPQDDYEQYDKKGR